MSGDATLQHGGGQTRRALLTGVAATGVAGAAIAGTAAVREVLADREPPAPPIADARGRLLWSNWSGLEHAYPERRLAPGDEAEAARLLRTAPAPIRPVGAGHSFTALSTTDATLLSMDGVAGLVSHDAASHTATVRGGTRLFALGPALAAIGQEMPNLPDINKQSLAGAMATGSHGTGRTLTALHGQVSAFRLVTPQGAVIACSPAERADVFHAALVGLGAFGVVSELTLRNAPLRRILKRSELRATQDILDDWPRLRGAHRNVEFFVLPFTGYSLQITHDPTDRPTRRREGDGDTGGLLELKRLRDWFGYSTTLRRAIAARALDGTPPEELIDEGWRLLSNERTVRFKEMEYHVPIENHVAAIRAVLAAIERARPDVFFPVEARVVAADEAWLSPFYRRETGSIAVHAYYKDDHAFLFDLVEPILRRFGGRPHWGKLHSLRANELRALYPRWGDAMAVRREIDPEGRMLNPYLRALFGVA